MFGVCTTASLPQRHDLTSVRQVGQEVLERCNISLVFKKYLTSVLMGS